MKPMDEIVTPKEYFEVLKEEKPTPKERSQKYIFENFIANCEKNPNLLSPAVEDVYSSYKEEVAKLFDKENLSLQEKEFLENYQKKIAEMHNQNNEETIVRKLDKAGYVNATIILVMILNIGFIIAMALLGSK